MPISRSGRRTGPRVKPRQDCRPCAARRSHVAHGPDRRLDRRSIPGRDLTSDDRLPSGRVRLLGDLPVARGARQAADQGCECPLPGHPRTDSRCAALGDRLDGDGLPARPGRERRVHVPRGDSRLPARPSGAPRHGLLARLRGLRAREPGSRLLGLHPLGPSRLPSRPCCRLYRSCRPGDLGPALPGCVRRLRRIGDAGPDRVCDPRTVVRPRGDPPRPPHSRSRSTIPLALFVAAGALAGRDRPRHGARLLQHGWRPPPRRRHDLGGLDLFCSASGAGAVLVPGATAGLLLARRGRERSFSATSPRPAADRSWRRRRSTGRTMPASSASAISSPSCRSCRSPSASLRNTAREVGCWSYSSRPESSSRRPACRSRPIAPARALSIRRSSGRMSGSNALSERRRPPADLRTRGNGGCPRCRGDRLDATRTPAILLS